MLREEYPPQRTNPARDLYKMWYALVQYHSPRQLRPRDPDNYSDRYTPAGFVFNSGHTLHVERSAITREGQKPPLFISGVMKIWPNGHFVPLGVVARWNKAMLDAYEKLTFLRWGYVNREKAVWVQDTPRLAWNNPGNRDYPEADGWQRRIPYLPLTGEDLFQLPVIYRLKFTTSWIIATTSKIDDSQGRVSDSARKRILKEAQDELDARYGIADKRYDWWQRRAELAAIRAGEAEKPGKPISALDRVNLTRAIMQGMTVYEPKVAPGGKPLPQQLTLPVTEKEVVGVGR